MVNGGNKMKKVLICLMLCIGLIGCTSTNKEETQDKQDTTTSQAGQEETAQSQDIVIKTDCFQIKLPQSWKDLYEKEIIKDQDGSYSLCLYEKTSKKSLDAGHLMSISLYVNEEDYSFLPSYEVLGQLTSDQDSFDVIVEYPTDVQFDEKDAEKYRNLSKDLDDIIKTIEAVNGYTYKKAKS